MDGVAAMAGMILQANFGRVGDYVNVISNVVFGLFAVLLTVRYVRCFRTPRTAP